MAQNKELPNAMDEVAEVKVSMVPSAPDNDKVKGVLIVSGEYNALRVQIESIFGMWEAYWALKHD